uniref:RRM domain-containing protein n=1 Tax=Parascaris equorum TaxID=6256 RepID=A0A914S7W2_PAREQ
MAMANRGRNQKLPPEVNRILYVKNLPYKITSEEMYDIFGKFGAVRQIRECACWLEDRGYSASEGQRFSFVLVYATSGNTSETRGTAFVVYEDIFDAKNACEHLSGFNVSNRYLVVLYYQDRYNLGGDLEREKKDKFGFTPTPRR